ncbi:hypothetical protein [uncultured Desulfobulbus sp.]|uniref:hypothetical protein n=1 Tax=uncultured Desulfobulbus sp. TaxID=239745 RepID=UPI0029C67E54|nr:hypothetical protein [uncultured Desulfobulbus sp.]
MTMQDRKKTFLIIRIIMFVILLALGIVYYIDSERYIGWMVVITAVVYLCMLYVPGFIKSAKSANADKKAHHVVVTDIRPYTYEDAEKIPRQGVTVIYLMGNGKKGKVNLTETTFQERFSDLKVGDTLTKNRDDSIPRKEK